MKRRALLQALATAPLLGCEEGPPPPTLPTGADAGVKPKSNKKAEIIVIGAGMSGMVLAHQLHEKGKQAIVLEARDRLGGRIFTNRSIGPAFDLGASWIHGVRGNPITDLAKEGKLKTRPTSYSDVLLHGPDGKVLSAKRTKEVLAGFGEVQSDAEKVAEKADHDISVLAAVKQAAGNKLTPFEKRALAWAISTQEVAAATELQKLSAWHGGDGKEYGGGDRLFPGGYDQVFAPHIKGLDIRMGHKVSAVAIAGKKVTVTTNKGKLTADRVVVTVPLGVLKRGAIRFYPGLPPKKMAAIRGLGMGVLDKVVLLYDKRFWPNDHDFIGQMSAVHGEFPVFLNCDKAAGVPALMAFCAGTFARSIEALPPATAAKRAHAVLERLFGKKIPKPKKHLVSRWANDPFAYGSYSHVPPGSTGKLFDALAKPVKDRIFFAGEATTSDYPGTVHGALHTGIREAERLAG